MSADTRAPVAPMSEATRRKLLPARARFWRQHSAAMADQIEAEIAAMQPNQEPQEPQQEPVAEAAE